MCGIVASIAGNEMFGPDVSAGVMASAHRGPDASGVVTVGGVTLGHTRLAIVDLDSRSDQPFRFGRTTVSFNGEIWNYKAVRRSLAAHGLKFRTDGDTEVVAAVLDTQGVVGLADLNGMFAIAWTHDDDQLWLTRDRFGEIPLHVTPSGAASEVKVLSAAGLGAPEWVTPGTVVKLGNGRREDVVWHENSAREVRTSFDGAAALVKWLLRRGVEDRTMADVPVCTLLSGGLDSSAVAWCAKQVMPQLVAYTAVQDEKSPDLRAARLAAEAIGCELREVKIPVPTRADLAATVEAIELPHKAQVEIGWACLVLAKRIREDGFKVVFSGEGSDELWGSYGFSYHGIARDGWTKYRRDSFLLQHRKNFARCNKAFMTAGVECRLPFLHPELVDFAWSLPQDAVRRGSRPKAVLEEAFRSVLPAKIVDRPKVAFQDALGMKTAAAAAVHDPRAFYAEEFSKRYASADRR